MSQSGGDDKVLGVLEGVLIAESLREGTSLDGLRLAVRKLSRWAMPDATADQPKVWTIIEFTSDLDPDKLAEQFADTLDAPGWYVDFHTEATKYVVFPRRVFRYARGGADGRAEVAAYARTVGVPDSQVDWST
jgi:hypothetical protein